MSWHGIEGHDRVVESFRRALAVGRLASTFLFVGPPGVGKRALAQKLAQALLCHAQDERALDACEQCPSCAQARAGTHPDLLAVARPPDRSTIPVELFIGKGDRRMREGLCHDISLKPFYGRRKVAIIDDADHLNVEGANALLKTLEEPPPRSVILLIGTSEQRQLPTIRSRCQIVRFDPLPEEAAARLILAEGLVEDSAAARRLAEQAGGSLARARELADPQLWEFRRRMLPALADSAFDSVELARDVVEFVKGATKGDALPRQRMRQVIGFAAEYYRQLARAASGAAVAGDDELRRAVESAANHAPGGTDAAAACLDRCLEALEHIDANANQATLLECWIDDLATLSRGRQLAI
jgi:DNA polymerase-3 subunit delta'